MRIIVATDGSARAELGVDLVASIGWPAATTIVVVEAVASGVAVFGGPWPPVPPVETEALDEAIRAEARQHLDAAAARLASPGLSIETTIGTGRPADVVTALAEEQDGDLIVVGSRGHGVIESMLLGSVSAEIVDRSRLPVLVARRRSIDRVVLGWDGSEGAEQAVGCLLDWGIFTRSEIHVVSVADLRLPTWTDSSTMGEEAAAAAFERAAEPSRQQHEQMAHEMSKRLTRAGLTSEAHLRDGDPGYELVRAAETFEADLIVVGTRGRTGLARLLLGSVARNVLHHAHCSVLVAHARSEDVRPA